MNGTTALVALVTGVVSFSVVSTADDFLRPSDKLPPGIVINEITIRTDGSTVYDREITDSPIWQAWSGQVLNADGTIHCSGGDLFEYQAERRRTTDKTADWLVGDDCSGLEAGMRYSFTWTPIGPDYAPVRYPAEGYGVIVEAKGVDG